MATLHFLNDETRRLRRDPRKRGPSKGDRKHMPLAGKMVAGPDMLDANRQVRIAVELEP